MNEIKPNNHQLHQNQNNVAVIGRDAVAGSHNNPPVPTRQRTELGLQRPVLPSRKNITIL